MKKTLIALAIAAATTSAWSQQAPSKFYAGASLGQSKFKGACDSDAGVTLTNCKDSDTAWKIFGGYQITPQLAVEVGYNDFGRISSDASAVVGGSTFAGNAKIDATAFELTGVGSLPLGHQFSLYGKLGVYYAKTESSADIRQTTAPFASASASASDHNSKFTFGAGARYDVTKNIGIRAEWQRYNKVGSSNTGEGDIDVLSIGGLYRF